ncbi:MAG: hypothetical protein WA040_12575 [Anaerolineae bacterium]
MKPTRLFLYGLIVLLLAAVGAPLGQAGAFQKTPGADTAVSGPVDHSGHALADENPGSTPDPWYSTQLHIHSWSNHNGAVQPGSIQMHSAWAASLGLDAIWWADHNPSFTQTTDTTFGFAGATIDPPTLNVAIPLPPGTPPWGVYSYVTKLKASVSSGGQAAASLNSGLLRMQVQANVDQTFDRFEYRTLSTDDFRIQGLDFTRPLASDPVLSFDAARCDAAGSDAFGEVRVALSWHTYGVATPYDLVYRLVPANQPGGIVSSSARVTVTVPLVSARVDLPLLEHINRLADGDDGSIQEMYFTVGAKNSAQGCMDLGNFTIHSRAPQTNDLIQAFKDVAARHQATYGVRQLFTWEQFAGLRHLNPYLPSSSTLLPGVNDIQVENFVPLIHGQNGLVMLNHPFGAGYGNPLSASEQEALVQSALATMLPVQAWKVDLIEIYKLRGRVDLSNHLRLWDLLGANGIQLCATATSDTHGGPFTLNHAMVVWINAASPSHDDMLAAMKGCRLFFGDLQLFDGVLDLRLGSTPMGSVYPARAGMQPLQVILNPLPAGAQVKLVQQLLQPGTELTHLVDHQIIVPTAPVMIDVSQPSQVRVEVWSSSGQMLAFSNRIVIQPLQCDTDSSGQVNIADVQVVAAAFGQTVPPAPARYDLRPDGRIDLWDITAASECWLVR